MSGHTIIDYCISNIDNRHVEDVGGPEEFYTAVRDVIGTYSRQLRNTVTDEHRDKDGNLTEIAVVLDGDSSVVDEFLNEMIEITDKMSLGSYNLDITGLNEEKEIAVPRRDEDAAFLCKLSSMDMLKYAIYTEYYNESKRITFTSRDAKEKYDNIFTDKINIGKMSTNLLRMTDDDPNNTVEKSILERIKDGRPYHYWISENVTNNDVNRYIREFEDNYPKDSCIWKLK